MKISETIPNVVHHSPPDINKEKVREAFRYFSGGIADPDPDSTTINPFIYDTCDFEIEESEEEKMPIFKNFLDVIFGEEKRTLQEIERDERYMQDYMQWR